MNSDTIVAPFSRHDLTANDFEDSDWQRAQPIHITRKWSGDAAPESRHAEARILWTNDALLVRFVCRQEEELLINTEPRRNRKTMRLWDKDVCEIFLAPDTTKPERYFEFEAAPNGEWIDLAIEFSDGERITDFEYYSGMTTAASLFDQQLIVAMKIPWSATIPKPKRGDVWRANLFRCIGVGDDRYLAWLPTYSEEPNFHVPAVFGHLEFA